MTREPRPPRSRWRCAPTRAPTAATSRRSRARPRARPGRTRRAWSARRRTRLRVARRRCAGCRRRGTRRPWPTSGLSRVSRRSSPVCPASSASNWSGSASTAAIAASGDCDQSNPHSRHGLPHSAIHHAVLDHHDMVAARSAARAHRFHCHGRTRWRLSNRAVNQSARPCDDGGAARPRCRPRAAARPHRRRSPVGVARRERRDASAIASALRVRGRPARGAEPLVADHPRVHEVRHDARRGRRRCRGPTCARSQRSSTSAGSAGADGRPMSSRAASASSQPSAATLYTPGRSRVAASASADGQVVDVHDLHRRGGTAHAERRASEQDARREALGAGADHRGGRAAW